MPCPKVKNVVTTKVNDKWDAALGSFFFLRPVSRMALRYLVSRRNLIPRYGIPQPAFHGWLV